MITIYHNPRCSKSRDGVLLLEESGKKFQKVLYLEEQLTVKELTDIIAKLKLPPMELVRKNEAIWKENYKDKNLSDQEIIQIMVENPKLIERPIVVNGNLAVIGRPLQKIKEII